jgi:REP element-mobilizing transposase RayT
MGRPLRWLEPDRIYFITNRCIQARLLLAPTARVNQIVGGVLAKAVNEFNVEMFAWSFVSNHFHIVARVPNNDLSAFMQFLDCNIARKVGKVVNWRDKFWARRFSAEPILDDQATEKKLRYLIAHGVKERLIERCRDWPGITAIPELAYGVKRVFHWENWTAQSEAKRRGEDSNLANFLEEHRIALTPLPHWSHLSEEERQSRVRTMMSEIEEDARLERDGKPPFGIKAVIAQDPTERPRKVKRSMRPLCHGSTKEGIQAYREKYRDVLAAYREASARFRRGEFAAEFPRHTYRPGVPWRRQDGDEASAPTTAA